MGDTGRPQTWLDKLPFTRAAFEEAMRLYPPAPSINRSPIKDDRYGDLLLPKGANVLVLPWVIHRHRKFWEIPMRSTPHAFTPAIARRSIASSICRSARARASASVPALRFRKQ